MDGSSGLFCSPAGHCHPKIVEAVHEQMKLNTYTAPFGLGHEGSFALAREVVGVDAGADQPRVLHEFGVSESIDTALKIAMAYNNARGQGHRRRFVSRERAYHGVNMGGVSLSGMVNNRQRVPGRDAGCRGDAPHLDRSRTCSARGNPRTGQGVGR